MPTSEPGPKVSYITARHSKYNNMHYLPNPYSRYKLWNMNRSGSVEIMLNEELLAVINNSTAENGFAINIGYAIISCPEMLTSDSWPSGRYGYSGQLLVDEWKFDVRSIVTCNNLVGPLLTHQKEVLVNVYKE